MANTPLSDRSTDELIDKYIKIRDRKEALAKQHKEELAQYVKAMKAIENDMLRRLNDEQAEKIGTKHGTAYKTVRTSATVADWETVLQYIVDREMWGLLEHRVAKQAVEEHIECIGTTPPGVKIVRDLNVNIRR